MAVTAQLHGPHVGASSQTFNNESDNGGLTDAVVWHFVLNGLDHGTPAGQITVIFANAGTRTATGRVVGNGSTQHFYVGTPAHDVLLGATAVVTSDSYNRLVLSHVSYREVRPPVDPPADPPVDPPSEPETPPVNPPSEPETSPANPPAGPETPILTPADPEPVPGPAPEDPAPVDPDPETQPVPEDPAPVDPDPDPVPLPEDEGPDPVDEPAEEEFLPFTETNKRTVEEDYLPYTGADPMVMSVIAALAAMVALGSAGHTRRTRRARDSIS